MRSIIALNLRILLIAAYHKNIIVHRSTVFLNSVTYIDNLHAYTL